MVRPETLCPHTIRSAFSGRASSASSQRLRACDETREALSTPATTPTLHSPLQLQSHPYRQHVQGHQGPFDAAHTHDGHAADAHDGYAPEPATLHEADHGAAQADARTSSCTLLGRLRARLLTDRRRRSTAVSQSQRCTLRRRA